LTETIGLPNFARHIERLADNNRTGQVAYEPIDRSVDAQRKWLLLDVDFTHECLQVWYDCHGREEYND
jgi:hypothetical protein